MLTAMAMRPHSQRVQIPPAGSYSGVLFRLNTTWHKGALIGLSLAIGALWLELALRVSQVVWANSKFSPHTMSQSLAYDLARYAEAITLLASIWILRTGIKGVARRWWMVGFWIQFVHHLEQATAAARGLLRWNSIGNIPRLTFVETQLRSPELDFLFTTLVVFAIGIGLYHHRRPTPTDELQHNCNCAANSRTNRSLYLETDAETDPHRPSDSGFLTDPFTQ